MTHGSAAAQSMNGRLERQRVEQHLERQYAEAKELMLSELKACQAELDRARLRADEAIMQRQAAERAKTLAEQRAEQWAAKGPGRQADERQSSALQRAQDALNSETEARHAAEERSRSLERQVDDLTREVAALRAKAAAAATVDPGVPRLPRGAPSSPRPTAPSNAAQSMAEES